MLGPLEARKESERLQKIEFEIKFGPMLAIAEDTRVPVTAYLRPTNLFGGGFSLTRGSRAPTYVTR